MEELVNEASEIQCEDDGLKEVLQKVQQLREMINKEVKNQKVKF